MDVAARTRIATAVVSRDASDTARTLVDMSAGNKPIGSMVTAAMHLRTLALAAMDRAVLAERAAGATWDELADVLGMNRPDVMARYSAVYDRWELAGLDPDLSASLGPARPGDLADPDPAGTAESLDAWRVRHAEPWDLPVEDRLTSLI